MEKATKASDLFAEKLGNLSAVIDRVAEAGEGFKRQNESILSRRGGGAGIVSQARTDVFANSRAFSVGEISGEAGRLNQALGNSKNSRELASGLVASKTLESGLPRVLESLGKRVSIGGRDEGRTLLPKLIEENFGGLPQILKDKLNEDINQKFFANEQASPNDIAQSLASGKVSDISDPITKQFTEIGSKLNQVMNKAITDFEQSLDTWVGLVEEGNSAQDNRNKLLFETANMEKQVLGRERLSVADRSRGFNVQLSSFADRAGAGGVSVAALASRENALNDERFTERTGPADVVAKGLAQLTMQQNSSLKALQLIATDTSKQTALAEDLNSLIDSRKAARGIAEDFTFGTPEQKQTIERQISLARTMADGGQVLPSQLGDAREGQRILATLTGAVEGPEAAQKLDQKFIAGLDRGGAGQLFGLAGLNPGVGFQGLLNNEDAVFQEKFGQLQGANRNQVDAAGAIADINRRDANQFGQNAQGQFDAVQGGLQQAMANGGLLDRLNETLSQLPSEIKVGGEMTVHLNILGGEKLGNLLPLINEQVSAEVSRQISSVIPKEGPSSKVGGAVKPAGKTGKV
jgi:hypothetical protein